MKKVGEKNAHAVALGRRGGKKGGIARSEKLSPEKRKEIAQKGARARWEMAARAMAEDDLPKAIAEGQLSMGIGCAVLEDGKRVLSHRGVGQALGRKAGGTSLQAGADLPFFLSGDFLKPFISDELRLLLSKPILYVGSGGVSYGIEAEVLPRICDVWLRAKDAAALTSPVHLAVADKAYALIRALAGVGMIALVDEATGYQDYRDRDALARILEKFIAKELRPWLPTFDPSFYKEMFRLRGWRFNPLSVKRPGVVAKYTTDIVYQRLAPGVLDELRKITDKHKSDKGLKHRPHLHRGLTGDIGHPKLKEHLAVVTAVMQLAPNWQSFIDSLNRIRPRYGDTLMLQFYRAYEDEDEAVIDVEP